MNLPDPETPVGARGIGEPPVAAGACAILNALSAALGDDVFRRAPVTLDNDPDGARARPADAGAADGAHLGCRSTLRQRRHLRHQVTRALEENAMAIVHDVIPPFQLFQPATVDEALSLLNERATRRG